MLTQDQRDKLTAIQKAAWNSAPYENIEGNTPDIHKVLLENLSVSPGELWLDIGAGTGLLAREIAKLGAKVTAQDLAPRQIETAKRIAKEEGLEMTFDIGDCQSLPYADKSFDVIVSLHGGVFAPDHAAFANELIRILRPGGRLGLTTWRSGGDIEKLYQVTASFNPPPPEGAGSPLSWGNPEHVKSLLGKDFDLSFHEGISSMSDKSPEAMRDLFLASFGPMKSLNDRLDEKKRKELFDALTNYFNEYKQSDGTVSVPREYLLIIGTRKKL